MEKFPLINRPQKSNVHIIKGRDSYVSDSAANVYESGANNSIGAGAKNIAIFNSSGCTVMAGVIGATIINSSGVIVTEDNQVYINGNVENKYTITTTNTSPINATRIPLPDNASILLNVDVVGLSQDYTSNHVSYHVGAYRCNGGTVTQMSLSTNQYTSGDPSSATLTISGQTITVVVTGISNPMNWAINYSFKIIK